MGAVHDASAVLLRGAAGSMAAPARDLSDQDVAARDECGHGKEQRVVWYMLPFIYPCPPFDAAAELGSLVELGLRC